MRKAMFQQATGRPTGVSKKAKCQLNAIPVNGARLPSLPISNWQSAIDNAPCLLGFGIYRFRFWDSRFHFRDVFKDPTAIQFEQNSTGLLSNAQEGIRMSKSLTALRNPRAAVMDGVV